MKITPIQNYKNLSYNNSTKKNEPKNISKINQAQYAPYPYFRAQIEPYSYEKYLGAFLCSLLDKNPSELGLWNKIELRDKVTQLRSFGLLSNDLKYFNITIDNSDTINPCDNKISPQFIDNLDNLKNFNFIKYSKQGLPLKYSRHDYLADLSKLIAPLTMQEKFNLFQKMDINPILDCGDIISYDGIINLDNLDKNSKIYEITNKFINNNEVQTDDTEVNKSLNSLISNMSEFVNIISKQQQIEHPYSLDIHTLDAFSNMLNNERYDNLSLENKRILKFSVLLHDIAKREMTKDAAHPYNSGFLARNIIEKFDLSDEDKNNIVKLVKNHYWLNDFACCLKSADEIADVFNTKELWQMAQILTHADIKAGNPQLFLRYSRALDESRLKPINDLVNNT